MPFSKEFLSSSAQNLIVCDALSHKADYEWLDLVAIPQRPNTGNNLYFVSHSDGESGWEDGFDRKRTLEGVFRDKGWDFVTEDAPTFTQTGYLQVASVEEFSRKLYEAVREKTSPHVIGVTGSVGKTTTVAFLEHLAAESGLNVVRFFSKRLSPLSVMCHYVNRVKPETNLVVMEYSAYFYDHVSELSKILPPDIAFLMNIYDTHINPGMFESKKDIFRSKTRIKQDKTLAYVNKDILREIGVPKPEGWHSFDIVSPGLLNPLMPPTLRTAEMYSVGRTMALHLGIDDKILDRAFMTFQPKENRIVTCRFGQMSIFFHGETSGGSRLWSWFETLDGSCPWLLVEEINFASEDPQGFKGVLERVFRSEKTFVLDTAENRQKLPVDAQFVDEETFRDLLRNIVSGYVVYHKALSTRQQNFNPEKYLLERWG